MSNFKAKVGDDRKTKSGAAQTDIAAVLRRAQTGALSSPVQGRFMDLTAIDFMAANNRIVDGRRAFSQLPSRIRARFQNDPYQLLRFLDDPQNKEEAIKLGLLNPTKVDPPKRVFEMTQEEWLQMQRENRAEDKKEANPGFKS